MPRPKRITTDKYTYTVAPSAALSLYDNISPIYGRVTQLDIGDTETPVLAPDGQKLTPAQWWDKTGLDRLPALLFFNETGEEVLNTDALVRKGRMMNSLNFTLERAYEKGWTYQRFARTKSIERAQKAAAAAAAQ